MSRRDTGADAFVIVRLMRHFLGSAAILVAIVGVFGLEVVRGAVASDAGLIALGALPDTAQLGGEYWRWVSFGLLHWDLTHLLLNSVLLLVAGPIAERRVGALWLLVAFWVASISSGVGISAKDLLWPGQGASVGASGGMFGLLGFALVLVYRFPPARSIIRTGLLLVIAGAFAYSLLPGISMVGHVVGFVVGALVGRCVPQVRRGTAYAGVQNYAFRRTADPAGQPPCSGGSALLTRAEARW